MRPSDEVLSVSALTELLRELIEPEFAQVWVEGELSNFRRQDSGHCYFSLKDEGAQLPAVLFRQSARNVETPLRDGMKVAAFGRLSIYPPRGGYQLICQFILPAGQGALRERFEILKRKLEAEGLFEAARKKPLPALPRSVGIITSPTGAALRDFLSILSRRGWKGRVVVLPARVQGAEAAGEIAAMTKLAAKSGLFDLLVLARGGGSLEDLWAFNEEVVARAVAACPLPTISAVGHETDFSLCDFAADRRAETPSAAAELISSLWLDAKDAVRIAARDIEHVCSARLERSRAKLDMLGARLGAAGPQRQIEHAWLRLDDCAGRLNNTLRERLRAKDDRLEKLTRRMDAAAPHQRINMARQKLEQLALRLESASPQSVLKRGFAIISRPGGGIVCDSAALRDAETVTLRMRDGEKEAVIGPKG
ncbi:MAG: exodeoxyribonuclease VII large subunit [Opitutales bacterium]|jgi:exodeoxyribonuclease VII large subunit